MSLPRLSLFVALIACGAACNAIWGIDGDYREVPGAVGGAGEGGTGNVGGTANTGGTSSNGGGGNAGCGYTMCGNSCVDVDRDPRHCGGCGNDCKDAEYCSGGECVCRPGLTLIDGNCRDTSSDEKACGAAQEECGGSTDFCEAGMCVAACSPESDACGKKCVDQQTDPLHCGSCSTPGECATIEVCVAGDCRGWRPALGCTACPCPDACTGTFATCCSYPGDAALVICVDGDCP